ncbi:MAG: SDR family NAD(P)-dependent oxidoreductase [Bacteroidetes bacterium]|nr:SDR family NAD(P)-dependent oxidoreductase [Bacteroidota bacterium]MDA1122389.1 SDR family NAD(P)-dependent oxidoreductase [Bacteroidota bacterium]
MSSTQKIALVTGSTGELGTEVVKEFANNGYQVVGTVRPGKFESSPNPIITYRELDLTNEVYCKDFVNDVIKEFGGLDVVVNVAGGFAMGNLDNTGEAEIDKMITLNFKTAYFISKPAFNAMKKLQNPGRIIFVSGKPALTFAIGKETLAYSISKSMLLQFSNLLNETAKGMGIESSVVIPGTMNTLSNRNAMPEADFRKWVKLENVAKTIAFLCSEAGNEIRDSVIKLYGNS